MAEYIKKNDLIKHIERSFGEISTPFVVKEIKDFPNADVVEVVRCKDCTYCSEHYNICHYGVGRDVKPDHYCGYGERRCEE